MNRVRYHFWLQLRASWDLSTRASSCIIAEQSFSEEAEEWPQRQLCGLGESESDRALARQPDEVAPDVGIRPEGSERGFEPGEDAADSQVSDEQELLRSSDRCARQRKPRPGNLAGRVRGTSVRSA